LRKSCSRSASDTLCRSSRSRTPPALWPVHSVVVGRSGCFTHSHGAMRECHFLRSFSHSSRYMISFASSARLREFVAPGSPATLRTSDRTAADLTSESFGYVGVFRLCRFLVL
jgi:hypothetical protein